MLASFDFATSCPKKSKFGACAVTGYSSFNPLNGDTGRLFKPLFAFPYFSSIFLVVEIERFAVVSSVPIESSVFREGRKYEHP